MELYHLDILQNPHWEHRNRIISEIMLPNKTVIDLESNKTKQISIFEEFEAFSAAKAAQAPAEQQAPIVSPIPPIHTEERVNEVKQELTSDFLETKATNEPIVFEINMPLSESQTTTSSMWDYSKEEQVEPQASAQTPADRQPLRTPKTCAQYCPLFPTHRWLPSHCLSCGPVHPCP